MARDFRRAPRVKTAVRRAGSCRETRRRQSSRSQQAARSVHLRGGTLPTRVQCSGSRHSRRLLQRAVRRFYVSLRQMRTWSAEEPVGQATEFWLGTNWRVGGGTERLIRGRASGRLGKPCDTDIDGGGAVSR